MWPPRKKRLVLRPTFELVTYIYIGPDGPRLWEAKPPPPPHEIMEERPVADDSSDSEGPRSDV